MAQDRYTVTPIGRVENGIEEVDDKSGGTLREKSSTIIVFEPFEEALTNFDDRIGIAPEGENQGLLDVIFLFDEVEKEDIELASMSSQGLTPAGVGGVFTRRTFNRPNRLGLTTVRVTERDGRHLHVEGLDALDGTPVLDLKPHVDWQTELEADR